MALDDRLRRSKINLSPCSSKGLTIAGIDPENIGSCTSRLVFVRFLPRFSSDYLSYTVARASLIDAATPKIEVRLPNG